MMNDIRRINGAAAHIDCHSTNFCAIKFFSDGSTKQRKTHKQHRADDAAVWQLTTIKWLVQSAKICVCLEWNEGWSLGLIKLCRTKFENGSFGAKVEVNKVKWKWKRSRKFGGRKAISSHLQCFDPSFLIYFFIVCCRSYIIILFVLLSFFLII